MRGMLESDNVQLSDMLSPNTTYSEYSTNGISFQK